MMNENGGKVRADHLKRDAYLYVRQSTIRQVFENTESTKRQYALRERAMGLGWPIERIIVIDSDLGQSGASVADREGFKRLVSEVGMGRVGIVLGLEVSRLARNCADWYKLLEICGLTKTLILDEDGLYDPCHFNDRLVLGLKGTMSEAELHIIKSRFQGAILSKAKRGELRSRLPIGFVYDEAGKAMFDPDQQIQKSVHLFFETFRRVGSASGTVRYFRKNDIKFSRKLRTGPNKGELIWGNLHLSRALQILHNPRYTGAFFYGRTRTRKLIDGTVKCERLPSDQWHAFKKDLHEGYISWEEYQENRRRLRENIQARNPEQIKSPPREGPAFLQGLAMCGVCGKRMTIRYHTRSGERIPDYICQSYGIEHSQKFCQRINGKGIDEAIGSLLIETVSPLALEVALKVQDELKVRAEEVDRLRKLNVERARYEADLARRRYMKVDPENRLVATSLEANWNDKLRALKEAQEEYEQQRKSDRMSVNKEQRDGVKELAADFPRLWNDPKTPYREKKRMVRLLIDDVTLIKKDSIISIQVRFKGGVNKSLEIPAPLNGWQLRKTDDEVISQIDKLLNEHTDSEIAIILNESDKKSGMGRAFNTCIVAGIRKRSGLKSHYKRLRENGKKLFTTKELSDKLQINEGTLRKLAREKILKAYKYNAKNDRLYELPGNDFINRLRKARSCQSRTEKIIELVSQRVNEVQYET